MRSRLTNRIIVSVLAIALVCGAGFALAGQGGGGPGEGLSSGALPGGGANGGHAAGLGPARAGDAHQGGDRPHAGDHRDAYYRPDVSPRQGDDPLHLLEGYDGPRPHDAYFEDHRLSGLFPDWRDWSFGPIFTFHTYGAADSQCIRRDVYGDVYRAC
jgi:hypothetical protein